VTIIEASQAYPPSDGIGKDAFIARVLEATDNPPITAALVAHERPVAGVISAREPVKLLGLFVG
jgi:hypothetical protein